MGGSGGGTGGYNAAQQLGNPFNGMGVSTQHPFGGSNSFGSNLAGSVAAGGLLGPMSYLPAGLSFLSNTQGMGGSLGTWTKNPMQFLGHGLNTEQAMGNQQDAAQRSANTQALQGSQYGGAAGLGSGGLSQHYNNLGYNNALSNWAQLMSGQNSAMQQQMMGGLGSLMALLPLLA